MPGQQAIDAWIKVLEDERREEEEERSQRRLALAYAHANGLPEPEFPLRIRLPEERRQTFYCHRCGAATTIE